LGPIKDMKSRIQFEQLTGDIKHRIHFLGGVQPDKVAEWMQISDILLLPSYKEGLPSALLEAMATGVVPIASNVGGIPSVIHHGVNGFLLQPGDTDALEAALVSCTTDVAL